MLNKPLRDARRLHAALPHQQVIHTKAHPFKVCCVQGGGVQLNNAKVTSVEQEIQASDLIEGRLLLLAAGKKNKLLVRVE